MTKGLKIKYPYMPKRGKITYVSSNDKYMREAKSFAQQNSLDKLMPNASIIVRNGKIIGVGANGSDYHELYGCERIRLGSPTGQDYDKCEGCHPKNHGEAKAITDALSKMDDDSALDGSEIYLWGHWWCCEACWDSMLSQGIKTVKLLSNSHELFNKDSPNNIIGHQFEARETI